jgi:hypothetical protein
MASDPAGDPDHPLAAGYNAPAVTIQFGETIIPSNQTILITSTKVGQASNDVSVDQRII